MTVIRGVELDRSFTYEGAVEVDLGAAGIACDLQRVAWRGRKARPGISLSAHARFDGQRGVRVVAGGSVGGGPGRLARIDGCSQSQEGACVAGWRRGWAALGGAFGQEVVAKEATRAENHKQGGPAKVRSRALLAPAAPEARRRPLTGWPQVLC